MEKVAREKLVVKIICVALATILWFYVSYQENPSMTKTVRNVPLAISGEQALKENGFSVYSISEKSVDVSVSAKRLSLSRLSNRTLSAVINVSSIKERGTYVLPATISSAVNSNATYYVKGKDIKVVIEPIKTASYIIEPDIAAAADTSVILKSHELSAEKAIVSAPESIMNEIAAVRTEEIFPEKNSKEQTAKLVVYGKNGKILEGAECTPSEVKVSYSFHTVKSVPVVLTATNGKSFSLPSENTVRIYGSGEVFDRITRIETEEVNLALFEKGSNVRVKLNLPKDIKLADNVNEIEIVLEEEFYK